MFSSLLVRGMPKSAACVSLRAQAIARHMSTSFSEPPVRFESKGALRAYFLNRPKKLNALDEDTIDLLRRRVEEWSRSDLCGTISGTGEGRAFCAGGDVATVIGHAAEPATRHKAREFFKHEFELDYILSILPKPYVAILDGYTMGGGVGLAANAPFRIATENTVFAMPETKIGYCPDVGSTHFLHRLDGELGAYLALTSDVLRGRAVFEHGFATHYVPSRRIPALLERLTALENPHLNVIDRAIEELSLERQPDEVPELFNGKTRIALDYAFRHNQVEKIVEDLKSFQEHEDEPVRQWAKNTLAMLELRSPTSLKVALKALQKGRDLSLFDALEMELKIATAYCNGASPDFITGVRAVVVDKIEGRPQWSPGTINEVTDDIVSRFFEPNSPFLDSVPKLTAPEHLKAGTSHPMKFALPTEEEIGAVVRGAHSSGGTTGITLDELVSRFEELRYGKMGVREKVLEVAQRRCQTVDNADGNFIWLKWDHSRPRP
ncbi:3-hydroxyisobutyryl-CoA hydrolase [Amanita muscaria]